MVTFFFSEWQRFPQESAIFLVRVPFLFSSSGFHNAIGFFLYVFEFWRIASTSWSRSIFGWKVCWWLCIPRQPTLHRVWFLPGCPEILFGFWEWIWWWTTGWLHRWLSSHSLVSGRWDSISPYYVSHRRWGISCETHGCRIGWPEAKF